MDSSELYGRSPRKELQGPRPTPLKIHKDSHKIRKPPVAPPPAGTHHRQPPPPPPRQPVIIYTVSPKIIHTNPGDFMNLVQRLTGLGSTTTSTTTTITKTTSNNSEDENIITTNPSFYDGQFGGGAISPAARYATIEKANSNNSPQGHAMLLSNSSYNIINNNVLELGFDQNTEVVNYSHVNNYMNTNNKGFFSGILSPGPGSLPPITPNFFSPPSDAFFQDLISPVIHGGNIINNNNINIHQRNNHFNIEGSSSSFFVSPRTLMTSPTTPSLDHLLFTNIFSDNNL